MWVGGHMYMPYLDLLQHEPNALQPCAHSRSPRPSHKSVNLIFDPAACLEIRRRMGQRRMPPALRVSGDPWIHLWRVQHKQVAAPFFESPTESQLGPRILRSSKSASVKTNLLQTCPTWGAPNGLSSSNTTISKWMPTAALFRDQSLRLNPIRGFWRLRGRALCRSVPTQPSYEAPGAHACQWQRICMPMLYHMLVWLCRRHNINISKMRAKYFIMIQFLTTSPRDQDRHECSWIACKMVTQLTFTGNLWT